MKHRNTLLFSSSLYDLQKLGLSQCIIELVRHLKYKLVAKNISRKDIVDLFISWKSRRLWRVMLFLSDKFDHVMTLLRNFQPLLASWRRQTGPFSCLQAHLCSYMSNLISQCSLLCTLLYRQSQFPTILLGHCLAFLHGPPAGRSPAESTLPFTPVPAHLNFTHFSRCSSPSISAA